MTNRLIQPPSQTASKPAGSAVVATDGELLMRFSRQGDHEAFAEVIQRHHAMIWGVCSRVLVRRADAEDAYQATLLILAKKSNAIRANDSAGGWLFRVAHNASLDALRRRKALRETPLEELSLPPEAPFPDLEQKQLVGVLLEELRALPTKYQTPLVLRYLEGLGRREIAAKMEMTVAMVAGQLVRGRRMLRSRLARRGVSLAAVLGAFGLGSASHAGTTVLGGPPLFDPVSVSTALSSTASAAVQQLVNQGVRSMFLASATKPVAACAGVLLVTAMLAVASPNGAAQAKGDSTLLLGLAATEANVDEGAPTGVLLAANDDDSGGGGASVRKAPANDQTGTQDPGASAKAPSAPATQRAGTKDSVGFSPGKAASFVDEDGIISYANPKDQIATAREQYIKLASSSLGEDLTKAGFDELYWQREHWLSKQRAMHIAMVLMMNRATNGRMGLDTAAEKEKLEAFKATDTKYLKAESEHHLANAKIAEYERLMKQAAVKETQPNGVPSGATIANWPVPHRLRMNRTSEISNGGKLRPGDTLLYKYQSTESPTPTFRRCTVDESGGIDLGSGFATVLGSGKTLDEVNRLIEKRFAKDYPGLKARLGASYRGSVTTFPSMARPTEVPSAILSPGDVVLVDSTLPKNVAKVNERCIVEPDGTIGLGAAIGRVKVSGLTMRQAEEKVQKHIDKNWDKATIQLTPVEVKIPTYRPSQEYMPSQENGSYFKAPKPLLNQGFAIPPTSR